MNFKKDRYLLGREPPPYYYYYYHPKKSFYEKLEDIEGINKKIRNGELVYDGTSSFLRDYNSKTLRKIILLVKEDLFMVDKVWFDISDNTYTSKHTRSWMPPFRQEFELYKNSQSILCIKYKSLDGLDDVLFHTHLKIMEIGK